MTSAEVAERVRRGQVNRTPRSRWAEYDGIVSRNVVTLFNILVTPAAVALFFLEKYQGAIAVSGMAIVNTVLGLAQELRAKWQLERLAILVETKARVRRDGQVQEIPAGDAVLDDLVLVAAGEAIVADGTVVESQFLEVDEALLTGESDPVRRQPGERVLSGSFCVAGEGSYRAERVGAEAFAQSISLEARSYRYEPSPLTRTINQLILLWAAGRISDAEMVTNMAATITSMVPQGLVLAATLSFTLGAIRMSQRGAIVQRLNAEETMAAIDVICTDKTGTLTTNRLRLDQLRVIGEVNEAEAKRLLAMFASASVDRTNKNILALKAALGEQAVQVIDQLPFKSQNRYSAVRIRDGGTERVLVLGACEALKPFLESNSCCNRVCASSCLLRRRGRSPSGRRWTGSRCGRFCWSG
ncbi:MAG: hypothetical protein E6J45_14910 [Chloroflexi bacterium]|nr:MAG: hypothetical protein E6J45_14910 [Chloroflexota bacterium]